MKPTNERTLSINCSAGEEVTKQQLTCFVHQLIADAKRPQPLRTWKRAPNSNIGDNSYYTTGFSEGTLITLRGFFDIPGVEMTYSRHGKQLYTAVEINGDANCDMHLAALLHRVICAVTMAEAKQKLNPLGATLDLLKTKPEPEEYAVNVGDVFRAIDIDELVEKILDQPTMLSIGVSKSSVCPERQRLEALIRATASYLQNVRRKDTGVLMTGFSLKNLSDGHRCGHLVTEPMSRIANAYVKIQEDRYYASLKPEEANLKFAADIVINLLAGI